MSLKYSYIGDSEIKLIANVLERKDYEYIRLSGTNNFWLSNVINNKKDHIDNRIGPEGVKALVEPLKENYKLYSLSLNGKCASFLLLLLLLNSFQEWSYFPTLFKIISFVMTERKQLQSW